MFIGVIAEELLLPEAGSGWSAAPFIDADLFPIATLAVPGFLLLEGQFDEGDVIYATFITAGQGVFPQMLVDPDAFYNFTKAQVVTVAPALVPADELFYSPVVLGRVLAPSLVIDDDLYGGVKKLQQGKATINQTFPIDKVFDADTIFRPVVEMAGTTLIPQQAVFSTEADVVHLSETTRSTTALLGSFVNETAALTAPPLGYLLPALVVAGDIFFSPDMRRPIVLGIFTDADIIYAASRFDRLVPGRLLDNETVFPGSFRGPTLLPSIVVDADAFFAPSTSIVTALAPSLVSDSNIFFVPVTSINTVMGVVTDTDTVLTPTVVPGAVTAAPSFIGSDDAIFAPGEASADTLAPTLVADSDTIFVPTENSVGQPSAVTDTDTFLAPTVAQAGFDGTLAIDGPIMPSTPPLTVILVEG